jgi:multimeric flavodoxin WrbA
MKIIAINGSPRGRKSVTAFMVEEFLFGARIAGATAEQLYLSEMKINHCRECYSCWRNGGTCIFHDAMETVLPLSCDILVLATPLFCDNVSSLLKTFIDRCVSQGTPLFDKDAHNITVHPQGKNRIGAMVALSNCGFPENCHFDVLRLFFPRMARNMNTTLIAEIYRSQGPLLRLENPHQIPEHDTMVCRYKALLQQAGKEIATNQTLSLELQRELNEPLLDQETYVEKHNKLFTSSRCT